MKAHSGILPGVILLIGSCNDVGKTSSNVLGDSVNSSKTTVVDTAVSGCFSQVVKRDTALLQMENNRGSVTGVLTYDYYQKDRNNGTLRGELTGDIIIGWYLFKSEGIMSVRQVAWKINGNELWPATGELTEKNDTTVFADPDLLKFDSTSAFRKIPCII